MHVQDCSWIVWALDCTCVTCNWYSMIAYVLYMYMYVNMLTQILYIAVFIYQHWLATMLPYFWSSWHHSNRCIIHACVTINFVSYSVFLSPTAATDTNCRSFVYSFLVRGHLLWEKELFHKLHYHWHTSFKAVAVSLCRRYGVRKKKGSRVKKERPWLDSNRWSPVY